MGQKVNPRILQLKQTNDWKSKYFEKKITECKLYSKNDLELRNFIYKFFSNCNVKINNLKLQYLSNSISIFILYYQKNITNFKKTEIFFINFLSIVRKFIKSKIKVFLFLKKLNENFNKIINNKNQKLLKKKFINLRKYSQEIFFKKGVSLLFCIAINKKCSKLLAKFISIQLINLKKHSFFIKFIKNTLISFSDNILSKLNRIQIKITGRLNGNTRAKSLIFNMLKRIPLSSLKNVINYSNTVSFTCNGTISVKVWILEKFF